MNKIGHIVCAVSVVMTLSGAAPTRWYDFKGLYVRMNALDAKKLGLDKCTKGQVFDENCERNPNDKTFDSIGGAPIKSMGIVIDKGKVESIGIETIGAFWPELITAMKKRYGAPKKETRTSVLWDRGGAEFISATVSKGTVTVHFGYNEADSEKNIRERAKKAEKDF
jgi:hypothetical protein